MSDTRLGWSVVVRVALLMSFLPSSAFAQYEAGPEMQVNSYTPSHQRNASVSEDGVGGFLVVWNSDGSAGDDSDAYSIQGQRFSAAGESAGSQFQVNTYTTNFQLRPSAAPLGSDGFVVAWSSYGSSADSSGYAVLSQRYSLIGMAVGEEFLVNTYTTGEQTLQSIGPDGAGGLVMAWGSGGSYGDDTDGDSVQVRF